jgi:hypothetical protein
MSDDAARLLERAWKLREFEQWDEVPTLVQQARSVSENAGYTAGAARSVATSAFAHYIRSDLDTALRECMLRCSEQMPL